MCIRTCIHTYCVVQNFDKEALTKYYVRTFQMNCLYVNLSIFYSKNFCRQNIVCYNFITYRKRQKFGRIKVWRISKEINLAEESLANFSMRSIVIFVLKSRLRRRGVKLHVLENGGSRSQNKPLNWLKQWLEKAIYY